MLYQASLEEVAFCFLSVLRRCRGEMKHFLVHLVIQPQVQGAGKLHLLLWTEFQHYLFYGLTSYAISVLQVFARIYPLELFQ